jgi:hypothetical protein
MNKIFTMSQNYFEAWIKPQPISIQIWIGLIKQRLHGGTGFEILTCSTKLYWRGKHLDYWSTRVPGLCTHVMKVKYFPNGELLDTAFPTVMSPTWRIITHGLELLKQGIIWRIGNGECQYMAPRLDSDDGFVHDLWGCWRSCRLRGVLFQFFVILRISF